MECETNTITISYHNKQTGQTMSAKYEISQPDKYGRCQSNMTLSCADTEGKSLTLGDFKQDPYGIAEHFVNVLLNVSDSNGCPSADDEEG